MQRPASLFGLILMPLVLLIGWTAIPAQLTLQPDESRLWIEGTSSIHDWTCEVTEFVGTMRTVDTDAARAVATAEVTVPVQRLECKNGTMNRKAYDALQLKDHPFIKYQLETSEVQAAATEAAAGAQSFTLTTAGEVTIAGATRPVEFTVTGEQLDEGRMRFTGSAPLMMSDFGIDPPTAMLGTLKTGDRVTVHFDVVAAP